MKSAEHLATLLKSGSIRGNEWAWTSGELPAVFNLAKQNNIAALGGTAQFRLENSTCEMYWHNIFWQEKKKEESWEGFVIRSNDMSLESLRTLSEKVDFLHEAKNWPYVREHTFDKSLNPLDFLVYTFSFANATEYKQLKSIK